MDLRLKSPSLGNGTGIPDVWQLDEDSPDWLENIIIRLLEVGVPPTAISKAFQVDVQAIKELSADLTITKYGTPEISEAMNYLVWRAYQEGLTILESAPSASRQRFIFTLLSSQSRILGKESPQSLERMRGELESLISQVGVDDPVVQSIYATSEFSSVDGEADDPEEGFEG
jgi:hypothetical protein